jgi:hypothetical protein
MSFFAFPSQFKSLGVICISEQFYFSHTPPAAAEAFNKSINALLVLTLPAQEANYGERKSRPLETALSSVALLRSLYPWALLLAVWLVWLPAKRYRTFSWWNSFPLV